jgi:Tol biopolymer transport system component
MQAGTTLLVSVNTNGTGPGNLDSYSPQLSSDGRWVVFRSKATTLAPGPYSSENLFVRDLQAGTTAAITKSGVLSNAVTPDGHFVAYVRVSPSYLYVWDTQLGQPVYTNTAISSLAGITPDGRCLLYVIKNTSALGGLDRVANTNWVISSNRVANLPGMHFSSDGRYLTYAAAAGAINATVTNQVYIYDFVGGTNLLVSQGWNTGALGTSSSDSPDISADGRFVAYRSQVANLVPDDANGLPDVFLFDRLAGSTTVVSGSQAATRTANNRSLSPVFGGNSQNLVFESWACDLVTPPSFNFSSGLFVTSVSASNSLGPFSVTIAAGGLGPILSWPAVAGRTYTVQFKNNLSDAAWGNVPGEIAVFDGTAYFQDLASPGTQRFYRVTGY